MRTAKEWAEEIPEDADTSLLAQYIKKVQQDAIDWTLLSTSVAVIELPLRLFTSSEARREAVKIVAKVRP